MMNTRKIPSILIVAILAAVTTFSSSTYPTPVLAQTSTEQAGDTTQEESDTGGDAGADTGGDTGADTGAARQDYQEFNTCLSQAEGDEGFATEDEIRECFQPIYIGGEASQDEESDEGSQDDGSGDEDDNNAESGDSEN